MRPLGHRLAPLALLAPLLAFLLMALVACASSPSQAPAPPRPTSTTATPTTPGSPAFTPSAGPNAPAVGVQPPGSPPNTIAVGALGWTLSARGTDAQLGGDYQVSARLASLDPLSAAAIAPPAGHTWVLVSITLANQGHHAYTPSVADSFQLLDAHGDLLGAPASEPAILPAAQALSDAPIPPGGIASGALLLAAPADSSTPLGIARGLWLGWRPAPNMRTGQFAWSVS